METCDILVAGGGSAGIAAALAAGRAGASVILAEKLSTLGGMGSAAQVHTFCGLYKLKEEGHLAPQFANPGLATELPERLISCGAAGTPVKMGRLWVLPHEPSLFAAEAEQWIAEETNIRLFKQARVVAVDCEDQSIKEVQFHNLTVRPRAVIDATGDALVCEVVGSAIPSAPSTQLQRPAFIVKLAGLSPGWMEPERRLQIAASISHAVRASELPRETLGASLRSGISSEIVWCTIDLPGDSTAEYNPLDGECRKHLWHHGKRIAKALVLHLKQLTGEPITISQLPEIIGIRESQRLAGELTLSSDHLLNGTPFPDAIATVSWPMELRETATGAKLKFSTSECPAQIPARCLRSASIHNLFAAGRCLSADHEAQAAIRVMGLCLATGEAAANEALRNLGKRTSHA